MKIPGHPRLQIHGKLFVDFIPTKAFDKSAMQTILYHSKCDMPPWTDSDTQCINSKSGGEQWQRHSGTESIVPRGDRDQFRYAPSQWETSLQCNNVSHWLGAYLPIQGRCFGFGPSMGMMNGHLPVWATRCLFKEDLRVKSWPHTVHRNGFSPVWTCRCLVRVVLDPKRSPHTSQSNRFSPVWIRQWLMRPFLCLKVLPHTVHSNDLSSVCTARWLFSKHLYLKRVPHTVHSYGFSPVCIRRWVVKLVCILKRLPHTLHSNGFSPVWVLKCMFRVPFWVKPQPHTVHINGFSAEWRWTCLFRVARCLKLWPHTIHRNGFFYPRPVLAFGYCRCLRLSVCVSVRPSVCAVSTCLSAR